MCNTFDGIHLSTVLLALRFHSAGILLIVRKKAFVGKFLSVCSPSNTFEFHLARVGFDENRSRWSNSHDIPASGLGYKKYYHEIDHWCPTTNVSSNSQLVSQIVRSPSNSCSFKRLSISFQEKVTHGTIDGDFVEFANNHSKLMCLTNG